MSTFKEGQRYAGEQFHGGCGCMDTVHITILKRNEDSIVYQEKFGNVTVKTTEARIETMDNWGEYIVTEEDRFFAYAEYV